MIGDVTARVLFERFEERRGEGLWTAPALTVEADCESGR
jgi:hypothetical protein